MSGSRTGVQVLDSMDEEIVLGVAMVILTGGFASPPILDLEYGTASPARTLDLGY
jgi:hypothetical protein